MAEARVLNCEKQKEEMQQNFLSHLFLLFIPAFTYRLFDGWQAYFLLEELLTDWLCCLHDHFGKSHLFSILSL